MNPQTSALNCAMMCFDFPDAAYFTYVRTNYMCTCRNELEDVLINEVVLILDDMSSVDHDGESNVEICTKLCIHMDIPEAVESVSYIRTDDTCYCHSVTDQPIFNIYGKMWEEVRELRSECLEETPKSGKLRYGYQTGNFTCTSE
ncbi:uncharacterized protein LOC107044828 [Diachasma alloeum]|uniref:uncharacterized protein LOC107044828 n=1 Tax=Diachasma alloeum TaxID=454923 RepID=UPI0007382162|nr:uncharacterized protein LOC107044828 [Diachasma alloeum]